MQRSPAVAGTSTTMEKAGTSYHALATPSNGGIASSHDSSTAAPLTVTDRGGHASRMRTRKLFGPAQRTAASARARACSRA
jgi:hypothetical protein